MDEVISILISVAPLLYRVIAAVIIIVATYLLTKVLDKIIGAFVKGVETGFIARLSAISRLFLYILAILIATSILAPEITLFSIMVLLIGLALIVMFYDALRNLGAELYVRYRGIVRKGDWIEVDGHEIHVLDLDDFGVWGETLKFERVFIPYSKLINSIIVNRLTVLGLVSRAQVQAPLTYSVDFVRSAIEKALLSIKEELAAEPEVRYLGSAENMHNFVVEIRVINFRKLNRIIASFESELKKLIPESIVKS